MDFSDSLTLSQTGRYYATRFEAVCTLFKDTDTDTWQQPCFELQRDEHLPLLYRVVLHYFAIFVSTEPEVELRHGGEVLYYFDELIAVGDMQETQWLRNQKELYDEVE